MSDKRLTIGRAAERTGCNIETIRFYERERLLPRPARSEGGHRLYTPVLINRLIFIRRSRELGFSMNEIRQLLSVVDGEEGSCEAVKAIATDHLRDVRARIADLRRMERSLRELSDRCAGGEVPQCPIVDALMPR